MPDIDVTKLISYGNLQTYDTLIKNYITTEDAKSIHTILYDSTNKQIKFYKKANATLTDTADYSVDIPADLDGSATIASVSNGVVTLKAGITESDGIVSNSSGSDITLAKVATTGDAGDVSYVYNEQSSYAGRVEDIDLASKGIDWAINGVLGLQHNIGRYEVYVVETTGGSQDLYSKRYSLYQGGEGSASSPVPYEKLADIDIPKDMVVESGSVVDIVFKASDNTLHEGSESGTDVTVAIKGAGVTPTAVDAGKYIKLVIANATSSTIYIKATDLVDIYTAQQNATQIQLAISSENVISATVVAGSIGTTELAASAVTTAKIADSNVTTAKIADSNVTTAKIADANVTTAKIADANVTTAKIADDAVTADKVSIAEHSESQTAGADGLAITVKTTDGQVSSVVGSIAANTYDAYGAATTAVEALDSSTASATNTADSGRVVLTEVAIEDGLITTKKSHTFGEAADRGVASNDDINALFSTT